jgi:hypothetical protein
VLVIASIGSKQRRMSATKGRAHGKEKTEASGKYRIAEVLRKQAPPKAA